MLEDYGIEISMCNDVLENAHCERANGIIKNEYLARWQINNFEHLKVKTKNAIDNYNNRKHNSIGMTPNNYEIELKTQPISKRKIMEIFTVNQQNTNQLQKELFNIN